MSRFRVSVHIEPRSGILDPQGSTVAGALRTLGFGSVADVRIGRLILVDMDAATAEDARSLAVGMCERLLANPVTEDFTVAGVTPE